MSQAYHEFLKRKTQTAIESGFEAGELNPKLKPFQDAIVRWGLRRGKAAIFSGCGTGKSIQQLEWSDKVVRHTNGKVLILAPLAVSTQTVGEGNKFDIEVNLCKSASDVRKGINITNYEKLDKFDPTIFSGVVGDEAGILKQFDGKTRNKIIQCFSNTPYKLSCTATPSPNDYPELGNQSEYLGVKSYVEMLSEFFMHDGKNTSKWMLMRHAQEKFWRWIASWAVMIRKPSDIGFSDEGYDLPPLNMFDHIIPAEKPQDGYLFVMDAKTLEDQRLAKRQSLPGRIQKAAELVASKPNEQWLIWCDLNDEGDELQRLIKGSVQIAGRDKDEFKEEAITDFTLNKYNVLITKSSIAGYGMNLQNCHNMIFAGLSHSFEMTYQAIRRCWRFGQFNPVDCHIITSEMEGAIAANIQRKERDMEHMMDEMVKYMSLIMKSNLGSSKHDYTEYNPQLLIQLPEWLIANRKDNF